MKFLKIFGSNSNVQINGVNYIGNNISIGDNMIYVDGVLQGENTKVLEITVLSNVEKIESEESINIRGNLKATEVLAHGSINCDDIVGNVIAGSNINCDDIRGNTSANGTINCDKITGNATANKINS